MVKLGTILRNDSHTRRATLYARRITPDARGRCIAIMYREHGAWMDGGDYRWASVEEARRDAWRMWGGAEWQAEWSE